MCSKIKYDLAIDARWVSNNRGIGNFILNYIADNSRLSSSRTILFIVKSSEKLIKSFDFDYKIVSNFFLISDLQISFFLINKKVNCLFAPGNILPVFPLFCKKKVLVLHDVSFYYSSKKFGKRNLRQKLGIFFRKILVPISLKRSDTLITVSNFAKKEIKKYFNHSEFKRIEVIYHGFKKYNFKPKTKIYTFLAVLGEAEQKNIKQFIQSCVICLKEYKFNVCLMGVSEEYLKNNNISFDYPWLKVEGKVKNNLVINKIRESSCLVMPSHYESFGMPVLESLINKTPVMCSDTGALNEITGGLALYFDAYQVTDIVEKMKFFINNEKKVKKNTEKWYLEYSDLFTLEKFHYNYNKILLIE